jgi:hypothetical protein
MAAFIFLVIGFLFEINFKYKSKVCKIKNTENNSQLNNGRKGIKRKKGYCISTVSLSTNYDKKI